MPALIRCSDLITAGSTLEADNNNSETVIQALPTTTSATNSSTLPARRNRNLPANTHHQVTEAPVTEKSIMTPPPSPPPKPAAVRSGRFRQHNKNSAQPTEVTTTPESERSETTPPPPSPPKPVAVHSGRPRQHNKNSAQPTESEPSRVSAPETREPEPESSQANTPEREGSKPSQTDIPEADHTESSQATDEPETLEATVPRDSQSEQRANGRRVSLFPATGSMFPEDSTDGDWMDIDNFFSENSSIERMIDNPDNVFNNDDDVVMNGADDNGDDWSDIFTWRISDDDWEDM